MIQEHGTSAPPQKASAATDPIGASGFQRNLNDGWNGLAPDLSMPAWFLGQAPLKPAHFTQLGRPSRVRS